VARISYFRLGVRPARRGAAGRGGGDQLAPIDSTCAKLIKMSPQHCPLYTLHFLPLMKRPNFPKKTRPVAVTGVIFVGIRTHNISRPPYIKCIVVFSLLQKKSGSKTNFR